MLRPRLLRSREFCDRRGSAWNDPDPRLLPLSIEGIGFLGPGNVSLRPTLFPLGEQLGQGSRALSEFAFPNSPEVFLDGVGLTCCENSDDAAYTGDTSRGGGDDGDGDASEVRRADTVESISRASASASPSSSENFPVAALAGGDVNLRPRAEDASGDASRDLASRCDVLLGLPACVLPSSTSSAAFASPGAKSRTEAPQMAGSAPARHDATNATLPAVHDSTPWTRTRTCANAATHVHSATPRKST
mmetsp:Transcript_11597/g.49989  ORF Transcript_11597/g.49989 Transcript_11597/m.49989 type:complete len:247 (-) Transcript_11597:52-792(-)